MSARPKLAAPDPDGSVQPVWWRSRMLPARGVRAMRLGERAVLFCERSQRLFELSATGDLVWRALVQGASPEAAAEGLEAIGASPDEACAFVRSSAEAWFEAGHLAPAEIVARAAAPAEAALHLRIDRLACSVGLFGDGAHDLRRELAAAFGQFLAPAERLAVRVDLVAQADAWFVLADGALAGRVPRERVAPELKAVVTDRLARSVSGGEFLAHAALLSRAGQGLLISGQPGAGKTTLTLALAAAGWGYGSDDIVRVSPAGFAGVPFSPAVKAGAWPLLAERLPQIHGLATHLRRDGQHVRYATVGGFASGRVDRVRWALILDRRDGAAAALEPVDPLSMLTHLLGGAYSADHRLAGDTLQRLAERLAGVDCRKLIYSDLDGALAAIEEMAGA